ncbi:MAG: hypothetical protein S4CHLAM6_01150 [Chlamydiae bacterium]|nr:hypothetical protein [Chlamydiota bacterium]
MSILKEVVKEVKALSALEYAAAINPNKKKTAIPIPKSELQPIFMGLISFSKSLEKLISGFWSGSKSVCLQITSRIIAASLTVCVIGPIR